LLPTCVATSVRLIAGKRKRDFRYIGCRAADAGPSALSPTRSMLGLPAGIAKTTAPPEARPPTYHFSETLAPGQSLYVLVQAASDICVGGWDEGIAGRSRAVASNHP
jgi:hypothetical protein